MNCSHLKKKANKMKKLLIILTLTLLVSPLATAQSVGDTLIIEVGKSKLMFIVNDLDDLEKIKNYDLNKIMQRLQGSYNQDSVIVLTLAEVEKNASEIEPPAAPDQPDEPEITRVETDVIELNYDRFKHFFNLELGMNNYLKKPFTADQMKSAIEAIFGRL